jgi:phosphopantetheinyl transferase
MEWLDPIEQARNAVARSQLSLAHAQDVLKRLKASAARSRMEAARMRDEADACLQRNKLMLSGTGEPDDLQAAKPGGKPAEDVPAEPPES